MTVPSACTMPQWTVHLEGGPRRVNHAAVAIGDKIYTFGGYCTGEDYQTTRPMDVHVLNTVSYRWLSIPTPTPTDPQWVDTPYQRYGHTAVAVGNCAYIWGGRNDVDGACNILFCMNTVTLKWSKPRVSKNMIPGARDGHSTCVINNKMYIFGGYEEAVDRFSNEVHELDFATLTWSLMKAKGSPPHWRDFHSATGFGGCMYIFGGRGDLSGPYHTSNEVYCNKIQVFNTLTGMWHEPVTVGDAPPGRRSHSAFSYGGELYVFGGFDGFNNIHFDDLYRFNPVRNQWSLVTVGNEGPCPRRRQCCCVIGDRVFLFGGTSPCTQPHSDTELDLMDHSDLYVLDLSPSLCTLCMLVVLKHGLDRSCLPKDIRWELAAMTTNSNISRPLNMSG